MFLKFCCFDCREKMKNSYIVFFLWLIKGNPADPRMRAASKRRGVEITSISRPIRPSDFRDFDIILAMDNKNRGANDFFYFLLIRQPL